MEKSDSGMFCKTLTTWRYEDTEGKRRWKHYIGEYRQRDKRIKLVRKFDN